MDLANESVGGFGFAHQVPESEYFKVPIRDFIATSIAPHISSTPSHPLLQEAPPLQAIPSSTSMSPAAAQAMAAVAHQQDSAILTDISSQAAIHGEEEAIAGYSNLLRPEEPYYPWTMSSSHHVTAGLSNYPLANFGDDYYPSFNIDTISYDGSSPILEPFQNVEPSHGWTPASSSSTTPHGSRKGKEILVEGEPELGSAIHNKQSLPLPSTSQNLSLLQQEFLEKLRKPPSPQQQAPSLGPSAQDSSQMVIPPSGIISSGFRIPSSSASSAGWRPIGGQLPPGHSPTSLFQPHRHAQFPRFGAISTRSSLIHKWATALAPLMWMRGGVQGPGSGGSERLGGFDSPATHTLDPRSPSSLAHDHLAAEAHKIAERKRRSKMNNKLRTLISIVPIIDKKDKVSVLTSTIEYIRQLTSRISNFENREEAAAAPATTSRVEEEAMISMNREEELALFSNIDSAGAGPSSSSSSGDPVVVVEDSPDGETWLIKVQANSHLRSLIQLLNVFHELGLEVTTVDYGTVNGRFRANVCIKNSRNPSMSSSELKQTLYRVLESVESSPTGSD